LENRAPEVPGSKRAREQMDQEANGPGSERAKEQKFQGAKGPGSEWARVLLADSLQGGNWPGSKKAMITSKPNA